MRITYESETVEKLESEILGLKRIYEADQFQKSPPSKTLQAAAFASPE